jgi:hypothetical protein
MYNNAITNDKKDGVNLLQLFSSRGSFSIVLIYNLIQPIFAHGSFYIVYDFWLPFNILKLFVENNIHVSMQSN